MYRLIISPQAQKELKKIKKAHQLPIRLLIEEIREDPQLGKSLSRDLKGKFSYRLGVYRIIYKINKKDQIINIFSVGHRSKVYD